MRADCGTWITVQVYIYTGWVPKFVGEFHLDIMLARKQQQRGVH